MIGENNLSFEYGGVYYIKGKAFVAYLGKQDNHEQFVIINGLEKRPIGTGLIALLAPNSFIRDGKRIALMEEPQYKERKLTRDELGNIVKAIIALHEDFDLLEEFVQDGGDIK
jgi:hypothetical protein